MVYDSFVSTTFEVKGYKIIEQLGHFRRAKVEREYRISNKEF